MLGLQDWTFPEIIAVILGVSIVASILVCLIIAWCLPSADHSRDNEIPFDFKAN